MEPEVKPPTLHEAASLLCRYFRLPAYPHWIQAIGECDISPWNDTARIIVFLNREPVQGEGPIPTIWQGFPVETKLVGEVRVGSP